MLTHLQLLVGRNNKYLAEINGQTPKSSKAMTPEQQEIQSLKKQLWRAKRDNEILKKATGLVRSGQSKHTMIAKMNKAPGQYKTKELCQLFKLPRSSYFTIFISFIFENGITADGPAPEIAIIFLLE